MINGIKECLLDDYTEKEFKLIPPQETNETFSIRYKYILKQLKSVEKDLVAIDILMNLFWVDDCLKWNDKEDSTTNFSYVLMDANEIWNPTVFVASTTTPIPSQDDNQIIVHSNGECEQSLHFKIKIICEDFPFYFPNDYQICKLNFTFKLITNFTLSPFSSAKSCNTKTLELDEWFIECDEFNSTEEVVSSSENWPFLSKGNNIYLGNINGKFKLRRSPHYSYSSIVLPSVIVCMCSQLLTIMRPYATNHATLFSSLFLSLTFILNNLPSFNKVSLYGLLINWIYVLCAINLITFITSNTITNRKEACLPLFQKYYNNICKFNENPISLCLVLSLTITLPILGTLLLKRLGGFYLGVILMIIIWIVIAVYLLVARILSVHLKSEIEEKKQASNELSNKDPNSKDKEDKAQIKALTTSIALLTSAIEKFDKHISGSHLSIQQSVDVETQVVKSEGKSNDHYELQTLNEEQSEVKILQPKEIKIEPIKASDWNTKLALCITKMLNCVHILGNIFLNITLWVIYYRFWEKAFL